MNRSLYAKRGYVDSENSFEREDYRDSTAKLQASYSFLYLIMPYSAYRLFYVNGYMCMKGSFIFAVILGGLLFLGGRSVPQKGGQSKSSASTARVDSGRAVAVTFDDLPATAITDGCDRRALIDLTERLIRHIETYEVPATGLVTAGGVCEALREELLPDLLAMWLDAGLELGNHTFSHFDLNNTSLDVYQQDIIRGDSPVRGLLEERGTVLRYFRHPLLHTGANKETRTAIQAFLDRRGYTVAPVTIDNQEWVFAAVYARAKERGDTAMMERVVEAYIPHLDEVFAFFEAWSVEVVGYEIPQVLLLHTNELNADHFDKVADMMKRRGYRFIALEEALQDQAYSLPDGYIGPRGLSWLHRWAVAKGFSLKEEPREPAWMAEHFRSY